MSTASETEPKKKKTADVADDADSNQEYDPDSFRMTIGEHLEELRGRLILAIMGLSAAVIGCLLFAERVMVAFCAPLNKQLAANGLPQTVYYSDLTDPFMTYLKITMIVAVSLAGPWIIFQIWQFVAAGLYPNERKMVTRYIPLSITLFIGGIVFVYFVVLPLSIGFFLKFSIGLSPTLVAPPQIDTGTVKPWNVPVLNGNPPTPTSGDVWIDGLQFALRVAVPTSDGTGKVSIRSITFGPESMMAPIITIGDYISLVITFMLTFGIAFQLPLVMLAVVSIGIVDIEFLKTKRKIVFFGMTVAAAFLAPGDIVTSMLALLIPLILLYEFGLVLIKMGDKRKAKEAARADAEEHARSTGTAYVPETSRTQFWLGIISVGAAVAGMVPAVLILNETGHLPVYPCLGAGIVLALIAIGCGIIARRTPAGKTGMLIGMAAVFFTVLIFFRIRGMPAPQPKAAPVPTTQHAPTTAPAAHLPEIPAHGQSARPNSVNNP